MRIETLTIVGVGLIGGSIGLAAKKRGVAERIVGVGRQRLSMDRAKALGAIDEAVLDLAEGVREAQIVVFCTPVDLIADQVIAAAPACKPGALLTDAGSTKSMIVDSVDSQIPSEVSFVGSHPLTGSEKQGPEHASPDLFQDRFTIVTQSGRTNLDALGDVIEFWTALGSFISIMDPVEHDKILGTTSHLPHLVAAALVRSLPFEFREFAASGFRDTTRVASGDPALWTAIFRQNRNWILNAVDRLASKLDEFYAALETQDWSRIADLLAKAKKVRDALGNRDSSEEE
jgi:prephenate dehydrogenase